MKKIKEGNFGVRENVVRRFECRNCGRIFDADRHEYEVVEWYAKDMDGNETIIVTASSTCPMCGEACTDYIRYEGP